ncbi:MAG: methylated-DNA--[protein]-cysteine S-methyltransferase [Eubacteriaceae bacterium]|nr:methylated-DNA--[protein]-cysteine S-methyltransferase [Eubacteriaceae bacterium]
MKQLAFDSELGVLQLTEEQGSIVGVGICVDTQAIARSEPSEILEKAAKQLEEYISGRRKAFDLPIKMQGTGFQKAVWEAMCTIPYGSTASYSQLAAMAGSPKGARAAGSCCARNPIAIIVPCHRVITKSGGIGGYAFGIQIKEKLLALESLYKALD